MRAVPINCGTNIVFHTPKTHLNRFLKRNVVFYIKTIRRYTLRRTRFSRVFVHIIRNACIKVCIRRMKRTAKCHPKGIFSSHPSNIYGIFSVPVYIDVFCAAVTPSVLIVNKPYAVTESRQNTRPVCVKNEIFLTIALRRIFMTPTSPESHFFFKFIRIIPMPIDHSANKCRIFSYFQFNTSPILKGHGKIAVIADLLHHGNKFAIDWIPLHTMHNAKKVTKRRQHTRNHFPVEINAENNISPGLLS